MGWTGSTRPRGNYARTSNASRSRFEPLLPTSRLATVTLFQSALVAVTAVSFIAGSQLVHGQLAHGLALVALASAAIVAFMVMRHDAGGRDDDVAAGPTLPAVRWKPDVARERDRLISDAEQLALLKARVCHELRTPLNAVIGFSELMHREALGPVGNDRYREYAGHIRRSAEHFQWATERTLAVTEILVSPRRPTRSAVPLRDLVIGAVERAEAEKGMSPGTAKAVQIDGQLEVEGCRETLDHALQYLMSAALAIAGSPLERSSIAISCTTFDCGQVALTVNVPLGMGRDGAIDGERAPGAELSVLLARLGLELVGAELDADVIEGRTWQATVWLSLARQPEFPLLQQSA